jgi:hypothetical protein
MGHVIRFYRDRIGELGLLFWVWSVFLRTSEVLLGALLLGTFDVRGIYYPLNSFLSFFSDIIMLLDMNRSLTYV